MASLPSEVPVELSREAAREAAQDELRRAVYQESQPGLTERIVAWLYDQLVAVLDRVAEASPGGYAGAAVLVVLLVAAIVAVRLRLGPLRREHRAEEALFVGGPRTAAQHRAAADAHAEAGRWAEAVRERLRAVIRSLEERSLLDQRPGRTAGEAAAEAGRALPECAAALRAAARRFDDIWYGGDQAAREDDRSMRALDDLVARTRPVLLSGPR